MPPIPIEDTNNPEGLKIFSNPETSEFVVEIDLSSDPVEVGSLITGNPPNAVTYDHRPDNPVAYVLINNPDHASKTIQPFENSGTEWTPKGTPWQASWPDG